MASRRRWVLLAASEKVTHLYHHKRLHPSTSSHTHKIPSVQSAIPFIASVFTPTIMLDCEYLWILVLHWLRYISWYTCTIFPSFSASQESIQGRQICSFYLSFLHMFFLTIQSMVLDQRAPFHNCLTFLQLDRIRLSVYLHA